MDKLISQQAAINAVSEITTTMSVCTNKDECYGMKRMQKQAIAEIENLPSIQPERKTGHWIYGEDDGQDGWYCSECNGFIPWDYEFYGLDNIDFIRDFKTCPFCDTKMITYTGADMRGEQDDS